MDKWWHMDYEFDIKHLFDDSDIINARSKISEDFLKPIRKARMDKNGGQLDYKWPPEEEGVIFWYYTQRYVNSPEEEKRWGKKNKLHNLDNASIELTNLSNSGELENNWKKLMDFCRKSFSSINSIKEIGDYLAFSDVKWGYWRNPSGIREDLGVNTDVIKNLFTYIEEGKYVKNGNYGVYEIVMEEE